MQRLRVVSGAADGDFLLQVGGDLFIRLEVGRRNFAHAQDHRTELALHDVADGAGGQSETRIRHRLVENGGARDFAKIDILVGQIIGLGDLVEARAGLDLGERRVGFRVRLEQNLLQLAFFGRAESRRL